MFSRADGLRVRALALKSLRQTVRKRSTRMLVLVSSAIVFGSLFIMWYLSRGFSLHFLTSDAYNSMSFDVECSREAEADHVPEVFPEPMDGLSTESAPHTQDHSKKPHLPTPTSGSGSRLHCRPFKESREKGVGNLTPTDILLNIVSTGSITRNDRGRGSSSSSSSSSTDSSTQDFSVLLSNIFMNGFPLLDLDDFVHLSDFVNDKLGDHGRRAILDYTGYRDRFGNFLNVRKNQLRVTGNVCLAQSFLHHLSAHSRTFKDLNVSIHASVEEALTYGSKDNIWAILDLQVDGLSSQQTHHTYHTQATRTASSRDAQGAGDGTPEDKGSKSGDSYDNKLDPSPSHAACQELLTSSKTRHLDWSLTVRMHPASIPDTRNFKWSPLKSGTSRIQSGQLLYFISGFLTLQLELQNYLATMGKGGPVISTQAFQGRILPQPSQAAQRLADAAVFSSSPEELRTALAAAVSVSDFQPQVLKVPLYHRAFPTHSYYQVRHAYTCYYASCGKTHVVRRTW